MLGWNDVYYWWVHWPRPNLRLQPISSNNTDLFNKHPHSQFDVRCKNPKLCKLKNCPWRNGPSVSLMNNINLLIFVRRRYVFLRSLPSQTPHRWGTTLSRQWGLWAQRILQIPLFRNLKGRRLLRVPSLALSDIIQVCVHGGAIISRDPVQSVFAGCSGGIPLLASILRSWHRGSWN